MPDRRYFAVISTFARLRPDRSRSHISRRAEPCKSYQRNSCPMATRGRWRVHQYPLADRRSAGRQSLHYRHGHCRRTRCRLHNGTESNRAAGTRGDSEAGDRCQARPRLLRASVARHRLSQHMRVLRVHPVGSRLAALKANLEVCKLTNDADVLRTRIDLCEPLSLLQTSSYCRYLWL
jgi:hypothetical protein